MMRLSHSDYAKLLDFIARLQEPVDAENFGGKVVALVSELIPGTIIALDQIHEEKNQYLLDHNCPLDPLDNERIFVRLKQLYQQNPIHAYIQSGGTGPVVRLSDLCSRQRFERTDFYQDIFRPLELRNQISVLMPRAGWITSLTINRDRDFSQNTIDFLALASRHLILAHQASCRASEHLTQPFFPKELTAREREVCHWMCEGKRNGEIAIILGCSPRTVEKHVENILAKTDSENRATAVRKLTGR